MTPRPCVHADQPEPLTWDSLSVRTKQKRRNDNTHWVWLSPPGPVIVFAMLRCSAVMCSDVASAMSTIVPIRPLDVKKTWLGFTTWSSAISVDDSAPTQTVCQHVKDRRTFSSEPRRSLFTTSFRW